jgi:ubiquinone/menaquinone biosynthesis C-methylase UbiE
MSADNLTRRQEVLDANLIYHQLLASSYDSDQTFIRKSYAQRFFVDDITELLESLNKKPSDVTVLDCGAGTGNLSLKFLERGCRVVGVDLSADMLNCLKDKLPNSWSPRFDSHVGDIDSFLERAGQRFDIVCSSSFLHHLPDYLYTYRLMAKCCADGGRVYTAYEPRGDNNRNSVQQLFTKTDELIHEISCRRLYNPVVLVSKILRKLSGTRNTEFNPYALVDVTKVEDTSDGIDMERLRLIAREEGLTTFKVMRRCVKRTAFTTWLDRNIVKTDNVVFGIAG